MVANKYAFLQITRRRVLNEWEAFKKVISRRNIRKRITIPLNLSDLFFFQAEDGIRDLYVTGVQTCALPICCRTTRWCTGRARCWARCPATSGGGSPGCARCWRTCGLIRASSFSLWARNGDRRSEEHTSELQSRRDLVCRLLLEKKKKKRQQRKIKNIITKKQQKNQENVNRNK